MTYVRKRLVRASVLMCALLLAGCTDGASAPGGGTKAESSPDATGSGKATDESTGAVPDADTLPAASPTERADPAKQPRTAAEARALVRKVIVDPEYLGAGAVPATPYESDPNTWAVLGEDCAWRRQGLPKDVLATLTRHFEVPGKGAEESAWLSTTVTVHRTALDAAWEQAGMLEEAVTCREQTLRPGERLTGLSSIAVAWGENANTTSDDSLTETGTCVSDTRGGPYDYDWTQSVFGSVVVSTSVCGVLEGAIDGVDVAVRMLLRVQDAIGTPTGSGPPSPDPATPSGSPGVEDKKGGE
ncbi:hypothetical protein [Streptomyces sp. ATCC 21386]|uniref:hypothetical protein n=1 Tax=Streptomyces sp. ATCC 21386 TaxID=2699428 RepID=UPI001BFF13FA|nr:hypothetical protein [Streptomyces sp. ATCC 21386]